VAAWRRRSPAAIQPFVQALPLTAGLARHKVEEEIKLVDGQTIDATTRKPTVH
jgi:hypothetical protein